MVAASPSGIQAVYGITNVLGPYTGSLKKSDTLQLLDEQGAVLLTVPYSNVYPWPVAADGTGHSLVLANPTYGEEDARAWDISDVVGGSPGQMEPSGPARCATWSSTNSWRIPNRRNTTTSNSTITPTSRWTSPAAS